MTKHGIGIESLVLFRTAQLTLDSSTGATRHITVYLMAGYSRGLGGDGVSSLGNLCGSVEIIQYRDIWISPAVSYAELVLNAINIVSSIMDEEEASHVLQVPPLTSPAGRVTS